ncbi:copper uptake system-associated protein [Pseudogemmobacter faecipullorum]|uniref:Copper chaperone PCu(A)C n=1 Tax=Pseudogemmobacter faecipullorum TaxID=2755041 RepID=A0ABS8CSD1_9RHOB|nr:copper uptake system-associated protein [Pseudogemmobacter faecipullorum]MCB5412306.1 copper chaperone PCu(A)C [Pseudogemmobacter faecipullorum]
MKRLLALLLCLITTPAVAHEFLLDDLQIIHPAIPATPMSATSAMVYMVLANDTDQPERLLAIETPFGPVRFERPVVQPDGTTLWERMAWIDIPAGDMAMLFRGETRGVIDGISRPLFEGGELDGVMVFEKRGRLEMFFMIDPLDIEDEPDAPASPDTPAMDRPADLVAVATALRAALDAPDAMIAPVVLDGDVALAGWTLADTGARAFLRRDAGGWRTLMWSDASLTLQATLTSLGVPRSAGDRLRAELSAAEAALGPAFTARFDAFPGTVIPGKAGPEVVAE